MCKLKEVGKLDSVCSKLYKWSLARQSKMVKGQTKDCVERPFSEEKVYKWRVQNSVGC